MLGKLLADAVNAGATGADKLTWITFMGNKYAISSSFSFLQTIFNIVGYALIPLFIAVAAGGAIYAIVLGVNLARAADAEARDAAKKRLIWAIVGLASIVILILLLNFLMPRIPVWIGGYEENAIYEIEGKNYTWDGNKWSEASLLVF